MDLSHCQVFGVDLLELLECVMIGLQYMTDQEQTESLLLKEAMHRLMHQEQPR